jgi:hypothetical protein
LWWSAAQRDTEVFATRSVELTGQGYTSRVPVPRSPPAPPRLGTGGTTSSSGWLGR